MYKNNVRVFISPPNWRYGFSPHPHLIVVDTFGEGRAGLYSAKVKESLSAPWFSLEGIFKKTKSRRDKISTILRQIFGEGGLSD